MQDRLDRLERDLSMLQRQVYRSAGGSVVPTGSGAAVDNELRLDRIETQMRDLTGRVEDAINGVEQLRRRLEQVNSDIDVRFGQGQGQPTPPPFDLAEWRAKPYLTRLKLNCQDWAVNGFGTPE